MIVKLFSHVFLSDFMTSLLHYASTDSARFNFYAVKKSSVIFLPFFFCIYLLEEIPNQSARYFQLSPLMMFKENNVRNMTCV